MASSSLCQISHVIYYIKKHILSSLGKKSWTSKIGPQFSNNNLPENSNFLKPLSLEKNLQKLIGFHNFTFSVNHFLESWSSKKPTSEVGLNHLPFMGQLSCRQPVAAATRK